MADVLLRSKVSGEISYDIYPDPKKGAVTVTIMPGVNKIPSSQYDLLKEDAGFCNQIKKDRYEELTLKEVKSESTVKELKEAHKAEINALQAKFKETEKKLKADGDAMLNEAEKEYDGKLLILKKENNDLKEAVKALEKEVKLLTNKVAEPK
ncbi:hypothetical protein KKI24_27680 [bacterium]|nr:hypothetical protein [bacterium]